MVLSSNFGKVNLSMGVDEFSMEHKHSCNG